jgi:site-specific DNA-methyltransferase (adenine-specific)
MLHERTGGIYAAGAQSRCLTCIANLSNDEVFTPPEFANRMLDTLAEAWAARNGGANIWADSTVTFLDPCTKSGVFLREITTRLIAGLADEIPDLQTRVDHILTRQVFGIGITNLTSLLARRSLYCSKHANGEHSVAQGLSRRGGNVWFERTEHSWVRTRNASIAAHHARSLTGAPELENHAYAFIHTHDIKARVGELFGADMQFDVIIGNPPYQSAWSFPRAGWRAGAAWTSSAPKCCRPPNWRRSSIFPFPRTCSPVSR